MCKYCDESTAIADYSGTAEMRVYPEGRYITVVGNLNFIGKPNGQLGWVFTDISFCPKCGRDLRKEATDD